MPDPQDPKLIEALLRLEIVDRSAINIALAAQKESGEKGKAVPLARILVQKGSLSYGLMERVLAHLEDTRFTCKGCGEEVGAGALDPRAPFGCQGCGKPLPMPETGEDTSALEDMVEDPLDAAATVVRQGVIGRTMAGCKIEKKLGEGGMGAVYLATHQFLQRQVAVKILPEYHIHQPGFVERFIRESRSAARIIHPNVVQVMDAGRDGQTYYIVMEFVEGKSLEDIQKDEVQIPIERALEYTRQSAMGLNAAAEHGIIHRDIKPDNIRIDPKGVAKVADFGLAKEAEGAQSVTVTGGVVGTPLYMSPEQAHGETVDFRSDIYSLGATLYHLVMGKPPFEGPSAITILQKHATEDLPPLTESMENCPDEVDGLVQKMMAKKREDRYQSYPELVEAIEAIQRGDAPGALAKPRRKPKPKAKAAKASPVIPIVIVAVVILLGAGGFFAFTGGGGKKPNTGPVVNKPHDVKPDPPPVTPSPKTKPEPKPPPEKPDPPPPPAPVSAEITSEPQGATVFFNDEEIGETPLTKPDLLDPGKGTIRLELAGHDHREEEVEVVAEETFKRHFVLAPIPASIQIRSEPTGAVLTIDDTERGQTPQDVNDLKPGEYRLQMTLDGYKPVDRKINLVSGPNEALLVPLEALPASLKIVTDPEGALVFMDGVNLGPSPASKDNLEPNKEYAFEIKLAGFDNKAWKQTLKPGEAYHPPVFKLTRPSKVQDYLDKLDEIEGLMEKGYRLRAYRELSLILGDRERPKLEQQRLMDLRGTVFSGAPRVDLYLRSRVGSKQIKGSPDLSPAPKKGSSDLASRRGFKVSLKTTHEKPLTLCAFRVSLMSRGVVGLLPPEGIMLSADKTMLPKDSWEGSVELKGKQEIILVVALATTEELTHGQINDLRVRASRLDNSDTGRYARDVVHLVEEWLGSQDADYAIRVAWVDMAQ